MRFARGTKVRIAYTRADGRPGFNLRWWHQVEGYIARARAAGATDFRVKGHGWKAWRRVP